MISMNVTFIKSSVVLVVCVTPLVMVRGQEIRRSDTSTGRISVSEVRNYRKMIRVNARPVDMVEETKLMCAPPQMAFGPHYDPGVVYYINETARQGMKTFSESRLFPVGSMIVKEKQERKTEDSVQIITVMMKVRPGRGETSWEYKMYDTKTWVELDSFNAGTTVSNKACIECHRRYEANDYVSDRGISLLFGNR